MSSSPQIFFSYAWGDEIEKGENREKIVTDLYQSLLHDHYRVLRDKNNLEYKGFISEFMARIGKGECIVVAISKKYVRSPYCMFELYEIARNSNFDKHKFREKVIPVIVERVDFTDPAIIDDHFSYWENEYKEWDELVKKRTAQLAVEQMQRYDKIKMIYQNFGKLTEWIIDMNTLNPQLLSVDNFAEIKKAITSKEEIENPSGKSGKNFWQRLAVRPLFWVTTVATTIAIILMVPSFIGTNHDRMTGTVLPSLSTNAITLSQPGFTTIGNAGEQLLIVQDRNTRKFGYARVNDTSQFISRKYDEANAFKEGMARVKTNGKYHFIRPDSTDAFPGGFDHAKDFQNGIAEVSQGGNTYYINRRGIKDAAISSRKEPVTEAGHTTPVIEQDPCRAICDTKGITGVKVSFIDSRSHKNYVKVSDGNAMEFHIPCYLADKYVTVTFTKDGKSEDRNVKLGSFEVPELFKSNQQ